MVSTSTEERPLTVVAQWTGRLVGCVILILGSFVFVSFVETGTLWLLAVTILGVGGALLFLIGLERGSHPRSRWIQLAGWLLMAAFSLLPTSLLFLPMVVVLSALPALFVRFQRSWYGGRPLDEHTR
jgi:hypothetical protein